jgi:hypothetical protein
LTAQDLGSGAAVINKVMETDGSGGWTLIDTPSGGAVSYPLLADDGTAAAPSYSFSSETNLGWYRSGADEMSAASNGGQQLYINNNGITLAANKNITFTNGGAINSGSSFLELGGGASTSHGLGANDTVVDLDCEVNGDLYIDARAVYTPASTNCTTTTTIPRAGTTRLVTGSPGAVTLTSTPTIATSGALHGQRILIQGTSDTNTVEIQDEDTLTNSKVQLTTTSIVLGKGDSLWVMYNLTEGYWYEIGRTLL